MFNHETTGKPTMCHHHYLEKFNDVTQTISIEQAWRSGSGGPLRWRTLWGTDPLEGLEDTIHTNIFRPRDDTLERGTPRRGHSVCGGTWNPTPFALLLAVLRGANVYTCPGSEVGANKSDVTPRMAFLDRFPLLQQITTLSTLFPLNFLPEIILCLLIPFSTHGSPEENYKASFGLVLSQDKKPAFISTFWTLCPQYL